MRLLIFFILFSMGVNGQIVRCSPFYKPSVANLFLDLYPYATIAVSFRKLRTSYTGNCLRVRRSSDNTEQDIGFSNNYLDTVSMKTFVGVNNGFVVTWYDQSGNGNDASQSTASSQPKIITSGVINRQNGIAAIDTKNSLFLNTSNILFNSFPISIISAIGTHANGTLDYFGNRNASTGWICGYRTTPQYLFAPISFTSAVVLLALQNKTVIYMSRVSTTNSIYVNSTNSGTSTTNYTSSTSLFAIGKGGTGTLANASNTNIFELIGYSSDKATSRTAMETNLNTFYSVY